MRNIIIQICSRQHAFRFLISPVQSKRLHSPRWETKTAIVHWFQYGMLNWRMMFPQIEPRASKKKLKYKRRTAKRKLNENLTDILIFLKSYIDMHQQCRNKTYHNTDADHVLSFFFKNWLPERNLTFPCNCNLYALI